MRPDDERGVPVPTPGFFATSSLRLNSDPFTRAFVKANNHTMLQRSINYVWIFRINLRTKTITAVSYKPVRIDNARSATRSRWTTKAEIVLGSTVDVVERLRVVGCNVVELRDWQVL